MKTFGAMVLGGVISGLIVWYLISQNIAQRFIPLQSTADGTSQIGVANKAIAVGGSQPQTEACYNTFDNPHVPAYGALENNRGETITLFQ